jgi:hypothetical protein
MSVLSPLSGVKRKSDFGAVRSVDDPTRDIGAFRGWGDPARLPRYLYASPRYLALSGEPKEPGDISVESSRRNPAAVDNERNANDRQYH